MTNAPFPAPITVVLAEDHEIVRRGLYYLLSRIEGIQIVGEAENGDDAVRVVADQRPMIILMDVAMPQLDGLEAAKIIKRRFPKTKVLVLTGYDDEMVILKMLESGVDGYLPKVTKTEELVQAMKTVCQGGTYFSNVVRKVTKGIPPESFRARLAANRSRDGLLTPREREILQLIGEGKTHQEIADTLHISVRTVDTHRNNILQKLNIHNTAGLVLYAVRTGLVQIKR